MDYYKILELDEDCSKEEIKKHFEENNSWYHSFNINGIQNSNTRTSSKYQSWISQIIPNDLTGKSILDVGCTDGFYSFLCEQRNATRVLAIDYEGFDIQKNFSDVESESNNILKTQSSAKNILPAKFKGNTKDLWPKILPPKSFCVKNILAEKFTGEGMLAENFWAGKSLTQKVSAKIQIEQKYVVR